MERLRVHVENNPKADPAMTLAPALLEAELARRPALAGRLDVTYNGDPERFGAVAADAEVVFAGRRFADVSALPRLRWVQSVSAGIEAFLPVLPPDVALTNASGVHAEKGGEFILTAALMLNYGIPRFATDKEHRRWNPQFGPPIAGKVAVLLGVGAIGGEGARLLKLLGARTVGVSRSGGTRPHLDRSLTLAEIDAVLPEADFLISSLPLTAATSNLIDRRRLDLLPARAGVVIVGRAKVFDCDGLLAKLADGSLGGAVLDVFPEEPLPADSPFWSAPNLVVTPHCSVDDHTVYLARCLGLFLDNLERYLRGEPLLNLVDREQGY
jgi:phosphoglycerate dehydrogenase-like enzyme